MSEMDDAEAQAKFKAEYERYMAELRNGTVGKVTEIMKQLSAEDRLSVMAQFCSSCGCVQPDSNGRSCQCWNDE